MRKDVLRNKKGLGTVVGMIFFVMVLMVGVNFFVWQMSQYDNYQIALADTNAFEQESLSEELDFQYPGIKDISGTGPYTFKILVNNNGPIGAEIVRIYIYDKNSSTLTVLDQKTSSSPYGFENGFVESAKCAHEIQVYSPVKPEDNKQYTFRIVTERGRLFAMIFPMPTMTFIDFQGSPIVYSHDTMRVKKTGAGGYDWRPPYMTRADVESNNIYLRALFANAGTSPLVLSTESVLLSQISDSTENQKVYFIGGSLIDPATMGWEGSLTIQPGAVEYLYFHIDSWNIALGQTSVFTGSVGLVGTKNGEFWSGAMLMDAIKVIP